VAASVQGSATQGWTPKQVVRYKLKEAFRGFRGGTITNETIGDGCDRSLPSATGERDHRFECFESQMPDLLRAGQRTTTPEMRSVQHLRHPRLLANGGVTVSYFEQVQNTYNFWPLEEGSPATG
jgi:hypothetical protein